MHRPHVLLRWFLRAIATYGAVGLVIWVAAVVQHPGAFGPVEWLMALAGYVIAWPVYLPLLKG